MKDFFDNRQNRNIALVVAILLVVGIGCSVVSYMLTDSFDRGLRSSMRNLDKITLLCLGVDKQVVMDERHPETDSIGQADGIFLISFDPKIDEVNIVAVPRDMMVTIEKYNQKLEYLGNERAQICLQYAYADGMEKSSELMVERVEELFPDTTINGYVSINIEAIMEINDAIGGVEVSVIDEYTATQMGIPVGTTLNLMGEDAMLYLRLRDLHVSGSAYSRLDRIKEYVTKAIPKGLEAVKETPSLVTDMYQTLENNMVTSIDAADMVELLSALKEVPMENVHIYVIQGEIRRGADGYEEFYPEESCMEDLREKMAN